MKNTTHTQCKLTRGDTQYICWLPTKYAILGKFLKLKDRETDTWENGWQVKETFSTMNSDYVADRSRDFKRTRKASDI